MSNASLCLPEERQQPVPVPVTELEQIIGESGRASERPAPALQPLQVQGCQQSLPSSADAPLSPDSVDLPQERLDSPTLVPCNTPALTPSNSFRKFKSLDTSDLSSLPVSFASPKSSAPSSSFNLSLVSDNSEDDDELNLSASLDALFSIRSVAAKGSSPSFLAPLVGLGISGIPRKDGGGPFDGLGLLSIRPSSYCHSPHAQSIPDHYDAYGSSSGDSLPPSDSTESLSDVFLQEMLRTFTKDPLHTSLVQTTPESKSWYELDHLPEIDVTVSNPGSSSPVTPLKDRQLPQPQTPLKTKRNFSSATISSELKRSLCSPVAKSYVTGSRARSASCPTGSSTFSIRSQTVDVRSNASTSTNKMPRRSWRF